MRALWLDRPNCSHNVSQKAQRIRRFSDRLQLHFQKLLKVQVQFLVINPKPISDCKCNLQSVSAILKWVWFL